MSRVLGLVPRAGAFGWGLGPCGRSLGLGSRELEPWIGRDELMEGRIEILAHVP